MASAGASGVLRDVLIIDLDDFDNRKQEIGRQLHQAASRSGFFYVKVGMSQLPLPPCMFLVTTIVKLMLTAHLPCPLSVRQSKLYRHGACKQISTDASATAER